jgi:hypothetical protein
MDCLNEEFASVQYRCLGQIVRCQFARRMLGEEWGTEAGERRTFDDLRTNHSLSGMEFIRDGFVSFGNESGLLGGSYVDAKILESIL